MASGLFALLDDVAMIAKLAAASLDDIGAAAGKAGVKAAGVVIDDTAVTPKYVMGLAPARELPIIAKIARGSLFNKLVILLPAALLFSAFLPWIITPILMLGGAYLSYEATEKILEAMGLIAHHDAGDVIETDPTTLENTQVAAAIRTDFILSAEIMAIALNELPDLSFGTRAAALAAVAVAITIGVYGTVGLIVKMDDVGLRLAKFRQGAIAALGRGMVSAMPRVLSALSIIGTAAMAWVGGGILVHGLEAFHLDTIPHLVHGIADAAGAAVGVAQGVVAWIVEAALFGVVGLIAGSVIVAVMLGIGKLRGR